MAWAGSATWLVLVEQGSSTSCCFVDRLGRVPVITLLDSERELLESGDDVWALLSGPINPAVEVGVEGVGAVMP